MTFGSLALSVRPAGLRGARFQAEFARSSYVGIGWDLWGFLAHFLPQEGPSLASHMAVLAAPNRLR